MRKCESCGSWTEDCECPIPPWRMEEYEGICDGCAQSESECLCDVDLAEVMECNSVLHPGCRKCEMK